MDGWPRIPNPGGGSGKSPRTTGTSLPAPGSTVVANVEDELGDGMYSLRWAGQKIHVSSRSPLAKGQALLLKSETSPEGKPRLVVLGPAPEQAAPSGRIIYGPNVGKKPAADQQAHQQAQQTVAQLQSRNAALSQSRIGGNIVDTNSRAGQADAPPGQAAQAGGQMAAGVAKATPVRAGDPAPGLIGLVLEPLPDFDDSSKRLLEAAKKEAEQLEKQQTAESEKSEEAEGETETSATDGEETSGDSAEEAKKNRKDPTRPAAPGQSGQAGQTGRGGKAGAGNAAGAAGSGQAQPGQTAAPPPQPASPVASAPPGAPSPSQPDSLQQTTPAQAGAGAGASPNPAASPSPPASSPPPQSGSPAAPQPLPATLGGAAQAQPPRAGIVRPASPVPLLVQEGGVVVPELPDAAPVASGGKTLSPQQSQQPPAAPGMSATPAPRPSRQPPAPGMPPQAQPNVPAANAAGQSAAPSPLPAPAPAGQAQSAPGQPVALPGQPVARPDAPEASLPQTLPGILPQQPSQPPAAPGVSAPVPAPVPPPAQQTRPAVPGTPLPSAPGASQPGGTPPSTPGSVPAMPGQPEVPSGQPGVSGGQAAPPPLPGTVVLEDGGSVVVPDVPVDGEFSRPQTLPGVPLPPAAPAAPVPGASQPADTPPGAARPDAPGGTVPQPAPGTSAPQPVVPGASAPASVPEPGQPSPSPAPQAPAAPPPSPHPGAYPRPGTATYSRPTPQQNYARAVSAADGATDAESVSPENAASSLRIKPEMLLREALGQMVGAAEIPLGNPAADASRLASGNKMPEAVLDKAAAILLRGAGLTPDPETMEAAKALVANNVPVDRDSVQALLTAAAGIDGAGEREATLRAAARLLSKDIPLSPPLVAGMADVVSRRATAHQLMDAAMQALAPDAALSMTAPEADPLMAGARELLDMLHVDLGRADAPAALERALSTLGREALGQALALVETSAQAVLENNPQLQKIDQALTALLSRLQPEMEQTVPQQTPPVSEESPAAPVPVPAAPPQTPPAAVPQANIEELIPPPAAAPVPAEQPAQAQAAAPVPPPPMHAGRPINAYLNAPKALPIEEMLKRLPPMPKVVSLGTPPPAIAAVPPMLLPGTPANVANLASAAAGAQGGAPALPPSTAQQIPAQTVSQVFPQARIPFGADAAAPVPGAAPGTLEPPPPEPLDPEQIFRQAEALRRQSGVMNKLGSLFQIPGLNRQELELLRPGGFLDRFLDSAADRPDAVQIKAEAEKLLRDLLSPDARAAERALREIPQRDSAVLRETASRLTRMESDAVRADPLMNKLSDAAASLRDLGRQLLAVKAENLALQDRNPGVMLAEVPFKLNDDAGDGRMQMFYRRGKKKGDGWSSRVILDLNTTRMGPVLGDMRFFGQDMTLNMFVDRQEAADYLTVSADELAENLAAKGFRVKIKFMVLPPPPPPPALDAERPVITGEGAAGQELPAGVRNAPGRLDIEL